MKGKISMRGGGKDVVELLKQLPDVIQVQVMRQAQSDAAELIVQEAKALVPVDTGELREFIGKQGYTKKKAGVTGVRVGVRKLTPKSLAKKNRKFNPRYGYYVEKGTEYQDARHFMLRAFDNKKEAYVVYVTEAAKNRINKAVETLRKKAQ